MKKKLRAGVDGYFGIRASGSTIGGEARAGLTTFLAMAYILFANPSILGEAIKLEGGSAIPQLLTATALAAAFGCLVMGLWARYPFALAPGMGLNAYFAYTVVLGEGFPWQAALGAVFLSGGLFFVIGFSGLRSYLVAALPDTLKLAITAGVGCFLAMIGLINGGMVTDHPVTLVSMGDWTRPQPLIAAAGLLLTLVLLVRRVRGAILFGIAGAAALAILTGAPVYDGQPFAGFQDGWVRAPVWPTDLFLALDLRSALSAGILTIVFTFLLVDFFDTTGTLVGLSRKAGLVDREGQLPHSRAAFSSDALATCFGALVGTSTTTSYIESAAGIEEGGKTGLTAVVVGLLFLASLFFWPLASAVPAAATAPALIVIGAMMMFAAGEIQWREYHQSVPAFLTILGMPLTFSITDGIALGILSYCLVHLFSGRVREVRWPLYLIGLLLALKLAFF